MYIANCNLRIAILLPTLNHLMRSHNGMRPQDVLILLKLALWTDDVPRSNTEKLFWKQLDLAREVGLSQTEISDSLNRSRLAGLVDPDRRRPMRTALVEFLLHGLRYVFPVEPGRIVRGLPTAHSAPPLSKVIVASEDKFVWPDAEGEMRGQAVEPLYPTVPLAARRDPKLYELLALVDALRVERSREQDLARHALRERLSGHGKELTKHEPG
jgi:hypothetical protein